MDDRRLLTHNEEIELAKRIEASNEDAQAAREELIQCNIGLVWKVVARYHSNDPALERDDLFQEGMIGLLQATNEYDWRCGTRFGTYAWHKIRGRVSRLALTSGAIPREANRKRSENYVREDAKRAHRIRNAPIIELDAPLRSNPDTTLAEVLPSDERSVEAQVLDALFVEHVLKYASLTNMQRRVVMLMRAGNNTREAARQASCSQTVPGNALRRLRNYANVIGG